MAKTIQAQAVRGLATPEQDQIRTIALAEAVTDRADDLSRQLYSLTETVKLASFAAEARRTLNAIHDTAGYHPEFHETLTKSVPNFNEVLHGVARELDKLNDTHVAGLYAVASAAEKAEKGGEA